MFYINCFLCLLLTAGIIYTLYLAFKRNKTIEVKGKDDFLSTMIILFICIIAFPITDITSIIEVLRTILLYLFLFSTFCIKRGINEKGIIMTGVLSDWKKCGKIKMNYTDGCVSFQGKTRPVKLYFEKDQLNAVRDILNHSNKKK